MRCSDLVKFNITMNFCYAFLLLFSVMRTTTQISPMRWCCSLLWEQQCNNDAMLFSNENVVLKILSQNNASRNLEPISIWFLDFSYSINFLMFEVLYKFHTVWNWRKYLVKFWSHWLLHVRTIKPPIHKAVYSHDTML